MLSYWLLWFVLPSGPEDALNTSIFVVAILLAKGRSWPFRLYLISLVCRLDKCVKNIIWLVGCYDVATGADTTFYRCLFGNNSGQYHQNHSSSSTVEPVKVVVRGVTTEKPNKPYQSKAMRSTNINQAKNKQLARRSTKKRSISCHTPTLHEVL